MDVTIQIMVPSQEPYQAPASRIISLVGQEIPDGIVEFRMTKEALQDLVSLAQGLGANVWIKKN